MEELYDELESMGVNVTALQRANLTELELVGLAKALRGLLEAHKKKTCSKSLVDIA